eukprot:scaffold4552_cov262-Chaetoceros_neogracile.AAC.10
MYKIPRYGHTREIGLFFSEDPAMRKDYMLGLILVFSILMSIAAVWFLSLIILRILGHRVGCAAGKPPVIPAEAMGNNNKGSVNTDETGEFIVMQDDQSRVNRTRIVFFMSVLYALAACGVLIWSFIKLKSSFQNFYDYAEDVKDGFAQMPSSLSTAFETSTAFQTPKDEMVTASFRDAIILVEDLASDSSWNTFNESLVEVNDILASAVSFIGFLDSPTETWYIAVLCATGALAVLIFYLLACAWTSGKEGYEFAGETETSGNDIFLNFVGIPLFAFLLAGTWFATSTVFTSGAANADFCYSEIKTGDTALSFLRNLNFDENSAIYKQTDDYLHGCIDGISATMPGADTYDEDLTAAKNIAGVFTSFNVDELETACNGGGASAVMANALALSAELNILITDYEKVYDNMSCEAVAPLIQKAVYEESCQSMSTALLRVFASGLCLSVFGTIILSLRSAIGRPQIYLVQANGEERDDDASYLVESDDEY